jgi:pimeloyl-ACP methyl ester carboxylesterase
MVKKYRNKKAGEKILKTYDQLLKIWGCDTKERDITTTYGTIHVIETGREDGTPLVLFHGVGDDAALMWVYNAKRLGEHFKVYAMDTMGGPGKSVPNENYNKDFDDIKCIDEVLNGLAIGKAVIAGVSNGAYLVQAYTLHRPEKVIKGICIAGAVAVGGKKMAMLAIMKIFMPEALFPTEKNMVKLVRKLCGSHYTEFSGNKVVMEHFRSVLKGFNNAAMGYHKVEGFTSEEIDKIRPKITYLVGEEDPFQKLGGRELLIENKMDAIFYKDAGHALNHELHDEINEKIIELAGI